MSEELQLTACGATFSSPLSRCCAPTDFRVAPEQTTSFLAAIELLGPRSLEDIRQAGIATLAPPPERRAAYDALFRHPFPRRRGDRTGRRRETKKPSACRKKAAARTSRRCADEANESGDAAARAEALVERRFAQPSTSEALRRLAREAPARLPRRRGHRRMRARARSFRRSRRTLRESVRNDGEVLRLARLRRRHAAAQDAAADRRLRLDEGAHRGEHELAHALPQAAPQRRDVHLRHPPDACDPRRCGSSGASRR